MTSPRDRLVAPVFITGSPRSGTTLMQNCLARDPAVYHLGRESRFIWHRLDGQEVTGRFPHPDDIARAYLDELFIGDQPWSREDLVRWARRCGSQGMPPQYLDLPHDLINELSHEFPLDHGGPFADTEHSETAPFTIPPSGAHFAQAGNGPIRMADKDTGHCWRLPELSKAFPDARFIFMVRDPEPAIRSLVAGWRHPTWFFTYRIDKAMSITGYSDEFAWGRHWWNFNIFPGYDEMLDQPLEYVCAEQWSAAMRPMIDNGLPLEAEGRALFISFEELIARPQEILRRVAVFCDFDVQTITAPGLDKVYMSMQKDTWNPGDNETRIREAAERARTVLEPIADSISR